ncbi:spermatogenesis-associated protein 7 [Aplochiton taeniatus]
MGYAERIMETKRAFCPKSSSKLTQSIIQDHMVSHYKKVYSAKSAIDTSVPKSLTHCVKYNDQIRRDRSRQDERPQSAHSSSRTSSRANIRASCSSAQSRVSSEESPYFCLGSSTVSNPRLNTSFHAKQIVYPSYTLGSSLSHSHLIRPASELSYGRTDRQHSSRSCTTSGTQSSYKAFMDPVQKTYSGDLLQKHSYHFTQDKPFTPRTLKSNKSSYLSQYRYYTSPQRYPDQAGTSPRLIRQETYHGSTRSKEYSSADFDDPPQGLSTTEWSDEDVPHISFSGLQSKGIQSRSVDHYHSPFRASSPEGIKSPIMQRVSAEEEELMYLEFIADVTNEILVRGLFSDKLLERVFERRVDMNRHRLDEDKMRHLLEVLREDLQNPVNTLTSSAEPDRIKEGNLLHSRQITALDPGFSPLETKEADDMFSYASLIKHCEPFESAVPLFISTPLHKSSHERIVSPAEPGTEDVDRLQHSPGSPRSDHGRNIDMANEVNTHANPVDNHEALLKDLESLSVSDKHDGHQGASDQKMNTEVSLSDDEF